jgi:hypothetical protein
VSRSIRIPAGTDEWQRRVVELAAEKAGLRLPVDSVASFASDHGWTRAQAQEYYDVCLREGDLIEHSGPISGVVFEPHYLIDSNNRIRLVSRNPVRDPAVGMMQEVIQ